MLIGPFTQVVTMAKLPMKGALSDSHLELLTDVGIWVENGYILKIDTYQHLKNLVTPDTIIHEITEESVVLPGLIDCHTHIAFGGTRAHDFAMRNAGSSYLEIAASGGGIWSTVKHTRAHTQEELTALTLERSKLLLEQGITTVEVKSGYGLTVAEELKMLRAIQKANVESKVDLIATCLAAHMCPKDFEGTPEDYLSYIVKNLFPVLVHEKLTTRIDAFVEKSAFSAEQIVPYFEIAKQMGFDITVHADQFTTSGTKVAVDFQALSADHLEASMEEEIQLMAQSDVVAVALPAASLGLGCSFTPARRLLDAGASLAIATDWNPGSAPMGQLIASASILATMQKLSNAEVLAGITFRAAKALSLLDRGVLEPGKIADFVIYPTANYQEIIYQQGRLQPRSVWKNGKQVFNKI